MSFNDPVAIILVVGAISIFAFLIHGLYFSGRSNNVKLSSENKHKLSDSMNENVAKVRIVEAGPKRGTHNATVNFDNSAKEAINCNIQTINDSKIENIATPVSAIEPCAWSQSYEINLVAPEGKSYIGADIEEICAAYGILRGNMDIFYVYEDPNTRADEVFRICSLEPPYSFPQDMKNYKTRALALYMNLPHKGNGYPYFKSIRMCANIFIQRLGGHLEDNYHNELTEERLDAMADGLRKYDEQA